MDIWFLSEQDHIFCNICDGTVVCIRININIREAILNITNISCFLQSFIDEPLQRVHLHMIGDMGTESEYSKKQ